ncbi:hypothetical protein ASD36_16425 [Rhizobium sp. Root1334]|nr:hypothetical protein ASD36_16425 [Rhizobium sp. Root1334]
MSCVQAIAARVPAAKTEHRIANGAPPMRRTSAGTNGADTTKPNGVIAADKPIRPDGVPCRSKRKESSG